MVTRGETNPPHITDASPLGALLPLPVTPVPPISAGSSINLQSTFIAKGRLTSRPHPFEHPLIISTSNIQTSGPIGATSHLYLTPPSTKTVIMSADTSDLSKVDSAVSGVGEDAKAQAGKKRTSSSYPGVMNINDLGKSPAYQPLVMSSIIALLLLRLHTPLKPRTKLTTFSNQKEIRSRSRLHQRRRSSTGNSTSPPAR